MSTGHRNARRGAMTRRQWLLGAAAASLVSGCGRGGSLQPGAAPPALGGRGYEGAPLELAFWNGFTGGDGTPMRELVARFNAAHPRIRVVMNAIRWDELYRKAPVAVASGKGPDVGVMHHHQLPTAAARGIVSPLDALAAEFGLQGESFLPVAWQGAVYNQKRYGIPLDVHPLGMFFNLRAFERAGIREAPATGEALDDALARLKRSGFEYPFWMPTLWPSHLIFETLLWQFGGAPFSSDAREVTFATDAGERAVRWMTGLYERGYSPRAVALDSQWNAFGNGTNAITWDGIWRVNNLEGIAGGGGVAPVPRVGPHSAAWAASHNLVLFGRPRPDAARVQAGMVFIDWISAHSLDWARAGQVPARNDARESASFRSLASQATLSRQTMRLVAAGPGIGDLQDDAILYAMDGVLHARDPRRALEHSQALLNDQLRALRAQFPT